MTKARKVLMSPQLQIPGLHLFGHYHIADASIPLRIHYHPNMFEITYIVKGVFTFSTESQDYKLTGGDVFITRPDEIHGSDLIPMSVGEIYWFLIDCTKTNGILFLDKGATGALFQSLYHIPEHSVKTDSTEMYSFLRKLFDAALSHPNPYTEAAYLVLFLQRLLEYSTQTQFSLTPDIGQAIDYIFDHIYDAISIEDLAASCNLSESRFKHKFKQQMGLSPRNFINLQKIEHAKVMLEENRNVTEIAMKLGFTTSGYFSTVFKHFTTFTPLEYRKKKQNGETE